MDKCIFLWHTCFILEGRLRLKLSCIHVNMVFLVWPSTCNTVNLLKFWNSSLNFSTIKATVDIPYLLMLDMPCLVWCLINVLLKYCYIFALGYILCFICSRKSIHALNTNITQRNWSRVVVLGSDVLWWIIMANEH